MHVKFSPVVKHRCETLLKMVSIEFRKTLQERKLPMIKCSPENPQCNFLNFLTSWKYFHSLEVFWGYPWNVSETAIRGMFFEYSGNIALWLLEFANRSTLAIVKSYTFNTKITFPRRTFLKYFPLTCSLNVPWTPGRLQHWGNTQRILPEYCVPAGFQQDLIIKGNYFLKKMITKY